MLDELFEVFERDKDRGGQRADGAQKRGIRGFFARRFGGGARPIDDAGAAPAVRPYHDYDDDDAHGRDRKPAPRRDRGRDDGFDFD